MREISQSRRSPDGKAVELMPRDWQSDRPKKCEPIFGSGALPFLGELIIAAAACGLLILVASLGVSLKGTIHGLLYGDPPANASQTVPPGNYKWTPEKGLERAN